RTCAVGVLLTRRCIASSRNPRANSTQPAATPAIGTMWKRLSSAISEAPDRAQVIRHPREVEETRETQRGSRDDACRVERRQAKTGGVGRALADQQETERPPV